VSGSARFAQSMSSVRSTTSLGSFGWLIILY
jgi:hypothetical protein